MIGMVTSACPAQGQDEAQHELHGERAGCGQHTGQVSDGVTEAMDDGVDGLTLFEHDSDRSRHARDDGADQNLAEAEVERLAEPSEAEPTDADHPPITMNRPDIWIMNQP